ncbi:MAG: hypothetical protein HZB80_06620 [Deltaproteobacteria bacterium]|nr:hypothetical protein [Deltaproteobacteria bacterium]
MSRKIKTKCIFRVKSIFPLAFLILAVSSLDAADIGSSDWRDYYRKVSAAEMLKSVPKNILINHTSKSPDITNAIQTAMQGKGHDAVMTLIGNIDEEVIFIGGLIYESIGFYPEASGSYERLIQYYPKGNFYRKALLRQSFINLVKGLKMDSAALIREASNGFYKVYKESNDPLEWEDALAGYSITLYESKDYQYAEEVFQKIEGHILSVPAYQFCRAENYMKTSKISEAKGLFQKLYEQYAETNFAPYLRLRLGDIEIIQGRENSGEKFYKKIIEYADKTITHDPLVMGTLAVSELDMKRKKNSDAIKALKKLLEEPSASPAKAAAVFYLIKLYNMERFYGEAISLSKRFFSMYPSSPWKGDVGKVLDGVIWTLVSGAYKKGDYHLTAKTYYENKGLIKDKEMLLLIGQSLLMLALPDEAVTVYKSIPDKKDAGVRRGLAKGFIMKGDIKKGEEILNSISPRSKEEKMEIAMIFMSAGDFHFRKGEYDEMLKAYYNAGKNGLNEQEFYLKSAQLYRFLDKKDDAIKSYQNIINLTAGEYIKAKAFIGIGDVYFSMKRWGDAVKAYTNGVKSIEDKDERMQVIYRMGEIYMSLGNNKEGVKAWEEVAKEDKGYLGRLADERLQVVKAWEAINKI